jgi:hypothetical protein
VTDYRTVGKTPGDDHTSGRAVERAKEGCDWIGELAANLKGELAGTPGEGHWWDGQPLDQADAVAASACVAAAVSYLSPVRIREVAARLRRRFQARGWRTGR